MHLVTSMFHQPHLYIGMNTVAVCVPPLPLPVYLLMQTNWPHSFPSLNNLQLQYLIPAPLQTPPFLSILHLVLLDSLCPISQQRKPDSLEVACNNGFLAFCFMLWSPARHLLLPAALGCVVTCSLRSFSSDRSNTLNRSSFARDSMMIEEILAPTKDTVRSISCYPHHLFLSFLYFSHPLFSLNLSVRFLGVSICFPSLNLSSWSLDLIFFYTFVLSLPVSHLVRNTGWVDLRQSAGKHYLSSTKVIAEAALMPCLLLLNCWGWVYNTSSKSLFKPKGFGRPHLLSGGKTAVLCRAHPPHVLMVRSKNRNWNLLLYKQY